jgi:hypothetical protein
VTAVQFLGFVEEVESRDCLIFRISAVFATMESQSKKRSLLDNITRRQLSMYEITDFEEFLVLPGYKGSQGVVEASPLAIDWFRDPVDQR